MWPINKIWIEMEREEIHEFRIGSQDLSKIQEFMCSCYSFFFSGINPLRFPGKRSSVISGSIRAYVKPSQ
jgi:hypothetical protein